MPSVWRTVTDSQVFNWIELLNKEFDECKTDIVSLTQKNKAQTYDRVEKIERKTGSNFHQFILRPLIFNEVALFIFLYRMYRRDRQCFDKIIIQTRIPSIGLTFYFFKKFTKARLIFESRGATIEERNHVISLHSVKNWVKKKYLFYSEKKIVDVCNSVIVVSNALKDYYVQKFDFIDKKFVVIPGVADANAFYFDIKLREDIRKKIEVNKGETLIVYSGAIGMKWEIPETIFRFVSLLKGKVENLKFLLLTPDTDLAKMYVDKFNFDGFTIVQSVSYNDVNKFLNAADIALLLREDILMNNVSSPTKFSEYILSGNPVIISKGVCDYSHIVDNYGLGLVINNLDEAINLDENKVKMITSLDRQVISDWGKENLSKSYFLNRYIELIKTV